MQDKYLLAITGIICICIMETAAIITGTNGAYLSLCVGAIASIIGALAGLGINIRKNL